MREDSHHMINRNSPARMLVALLTLFSFTLSLAGCSGETKIQGAGATFPDPLYQKWFSEYNKAPTKDDDLSKASGPILHIPTCLGAVVITYNLPGVTTDLKLTPEAIAGIFLGSIKKWNDAAIASVNEGA